MPKSTTKLATIQERAIAKDLQGRRQPGSGSRWHSKADVKAGRFLVEAKHTAAKQYTVKWADLFKVKKAAMYEGREWVLWVELGSGQKFAVVDTNVILELEERYRNEQAG